jgi:nitronate monooxygenase
MVANRGFQYIPQRKVSGMSPIPFARVFNPSHPFPTLTVSGTEEEVTIGCGGMGVHLSTTIAGLCAKLGMVGMVSSVAAGHMASIELDRNVSQADAVELYVKRSLDESRGFGAIGVNVMWLLKTILDQSIEGAIRGGAHYIYAGAGFARDLANKVAGAKIGLVPIVSSAEGLEIICKSWAKKGTGPAAIVLEGWKAGGHLGFGPDEIGQPEYSLEVLLEQVLITAGRYGNPPVFVAGGIWDVTDVLQFASLGARGVQVATPFLGTTEIGLCRKGKAALLTATPDDIIVTCKPPKGDLAPNLAGVHIVPGMGSPSMLAFTVEKRAHAAAIAQDELPCLGYLMHNGDCPAKHNLAMCLCNGLIAATELAERKRPGVYGEPIVTCGLNAYRIKEKGFIPLAERLADLRGLEA